MPITQVIGQCESQIIWVAGFNQYVILTFYLVPIAGLVEF